MEATTAPAKSPKTPKKSPAALLKEDFWSSRQTLHAERVVKVGKDKVRAEVARDSYDDQSYARVSVWTTERGWKYLTAIPFEKSEMRKASPYGDKAAWPATAKKDLDTLIAHAVTILA